MVPTALPPPPRSSVRAIHFGGSEAVVAPTPQSVPITKEAAVPKPSWTAPPPQPGPPAEQGALTQPRHYQCVPPRQPPQDIVAYQVGGDSDQDVLDTVEAGAWGPKPRTELQTKTMIKVKLTRFLDDPRYQTSAACSKLLDKVFSKLNGRRIY